MKTQIHRVYKLRRNARKEERRLQRWLATANSKDKFDSAVPNWAQGVRVEKAGFFQWAVVYTSTKGT